MTSLAASIARSLVPARSSVTRLRASEPEAIAFEDWIAMFSGMSSMPFVMNPLGAQEEEIVATAMGLQRALNTNGAIFACELVRIMLFSEARFQFRRRDSGQPGDLFGDTSLKLLEQPQGPGSTTATMNKRAMLHADFGGAAFMVRRRARVRQPRPDWMTVILGSYDDPEIDGDDLDADVIGYLYHPGGRGGGDRPVSLLPEQVATFVPFPDPLAHVRGIPWPSVVSRNVMAHNAATTHKLKFFENGATPQMVVSLDKDLKDPAKFREWIEVLEQDHKGVTNAYRTLYLGAGAQATVVGANVNQLDFKDTQGADETMIAAAAGVGAVVAQLSEGLQGSSLNVGNFAAAMRRVADLTMRPLWRDMAGSLSVIVPPPAGAELWYDDRDIPALKDDIKDAAEVMSLNAQAIRTLWDGGAEPDTAIAAIVSGDLRKITHSGKLSVQLTDPNAPPPKPAPAAPAPPAPAAGAVSVHPAPIALLGDGVPGGGRPPSPFVPSAVRCANPDCGHLLAELATAPYRMRCRHCKRVTEVAFSEDQPRDDHGRFGEGGGGSSSSGESISAGPGITAGPAEHDVNKGLWDQFGDLKGPGSESLAHPFSTSLRSNIKIANANAIGTRLEASMGREAILATPFGAASAAAYPELSAGAAAFAGMQDQWADTSGDSTPAALAMQLSTEREFGLESAQDPRYTYGVIADPGVTAQVDADLAANGELYQAVARAEYDHTQAFLADEGITEMTMYRGVSLPPDHPTAVAVEAVPYGTSTTVGFQTNPMTSFSADSTASATYAENGYGGTGTKGYIMSVKMPASRILSTSMTGRGCMGEYEAVVLAGEGDEATAWRL